MRRGPLSGGPRRAHGSSGALRPPRARARLRRAPDGPGGRGRPRHQTDVPSGAKRRDHLGAPAPRRSAPPRLRRTGSIMPRSPPKAACKSAPKPLLRKRTGPPSGENVQGLLGFERRRRSAAASRPVLVRSVRFGPAAQMAAERSAGLGPERPLARTGRNRAPPSCRARSSVGAGRVDLALNPAVSPARFGGAARRGRRPDRAAAPLGRPLRACNGPPSRWSGAPACPRRSCPRRTRDHRAGRKPWKHADDRGRQGARFRPRSLP
jgi:hypothetical protein